MFTDNVHAATTVLLYTQTVAFLWFKGLSLALQLLKLTMFILAMYRNYDKVIVHIITFSYVMCNDCGLCMVLWSVRERRMAQYRWLQLSRFSVGVFSRFSPPLASG